MFLALAGIAIGLIVLGARSNPSPGPQAGAPVVEPPSGPFKTRYDGPQTAQEAPAERAIYDALPGASSPAGAVSAKTAPSAAAPVQAPPPAKAAPQTPPETVSPVKAAPAQPIAVAAPKAAATPTFSTTGGFLVQLGAFSSRAKAADAWTAVQARAPADLRGAILDVQRRDGDDGSVLYRLRAGFLADRAAAEQLCRRLQALGQACLTVTR